MKKSVDNVKKTGDKCPTCNNRRIVRTRTRMATIPCPACRSEVKRQMQNRINAAPKEEDK